MNIRPVVLSLVMLVSINAVQVIEKECDFNTKISGKKPVVCKFFAPWCGPCKASTPIVEELSKERKDLEIIEVSHEGGQDSKKIFDTYNIKSFPTFVIFDKGQEVGRFSGFKKKDDLSQEIDKFLKKTPVKSAALSEKEVAKKEDDVVDEIAKQQDAIQQFAQALATGDFEAIKKSITKETINYVLETPMMDLNIILLLLLNDVERAEELIDHALSLKPDLTKQINFSGKKQTLKKHLDEMSVALKKKADLVAKVAKKLA